MKLFNHWIFLTWLLFPLSLLAAPAITEQSVRDMIEQIEQAVGEQDIEGVITHIAADAVIVFDMPSNAGGRIEIGRAEYKNMLAQSWSVPIDYTHEIRDIDITIASGGDSATATYLTLETAKANGQLIASSKIESKFKVKLINGISQITFVYGRVEFSVPQQASL